MNTKSTLYVFLWLLGLLALAIVAISPTILLGYDQIAFKVVPALQAVSVHVFGY